MTLVIVTILILCYVLIATERITNVNKAAVAIFAGTVGWVFYICYGNDFVMSQHAADYTDFLNGAVATSTAVKEYISRNIFLRYVGRASEIVLFLLCTMTIVEVLANNGCFDFITQTLKTRSSKRMLWTVSVITLVLSANLDNLTTTIMMLFILRKVVSNRSQRLIFGSAILLSANFGGAMTVIGDPTGLLLWNDGHVSATAYSMQLILPCLVSWAIPVWWLGRELPERVQTEWITMPYRGDDTRLSETQRLIMLIVGIGGLWFIPTFHNITKLSPFLGALCVLSLLWIVNEIMNHRLLNSDILIKHTFPRMLQYSAVQMILYVMGIMLAVGVVKETGAFDWLWSQMAGVRDNVWFIGLVSGLISVVLDNFATAMSMITLNPDSALNADYWMMVAFAVTVGGNILCTGSMAGLMLMKTEKVRGGWYLRHVGVKALCGGLVGLLVMYLICLH